jgi:hypothetical protein
MLPIGLVLLAVDVQPLLDWLEGHRPDWLANGGFAELRLA